MWLCAAVLWLHHMEEGFSLCSWLILANVFKALSLPWILSGLSLSVKIISFNVLNQSAWTYVSLVLHSPPSLRQVLLVLRVEALIWGWMLDWCWYVISLYWLSNWLIYFELLVLDLWYSERLRPIHILWAVFARLKDMRGPLLDLNLTWLSLLEILALLNGLVGNALLWGCPSWMACV